MTPLGLSSAVALVADTARELLDHHIPQDDAIDLLLTAMVIAALRQTKGNKCKAAKLLHVHRNTINRQTEKWGLDSFIEGIKQNRHVKQLDLFRNKRPAPRVESLAA